MSDRVTLSIDDVEVHGRAGQTILEAADEAGIYIPRLCYLKGLEPFGSCRVCTVLVNGRPQAACTQPISQGMVVESATEKVREIRKDLIDMLFVEGNHFCMFCEKSGNCELQAMAYRFGITAPKYPYMFPKREVDASHPDILIDHNRCIRCARCVRASRDLDGKEVKISSFANHLFNATRPPQVFHVSELVRPRIKEAGPGVINQKVQLIAFQQG